MPVTGGPTPTVSVQVPVPVPAQPSRSPAVAPPRPAVRPGVSFGRPAGGGRLRAVILPWSPAPKRRLSRLPARVIRYATKKPAGPGAKPTPAPGVDLSHFLYPQEIQTLAASNPATIDQFNKTVSRSLGDKPGHVPGVGEIQALAELGEPAHGGYEAQHHAVTTLLGMAKKGGKGGRYEPADADRWAALNAIWSPRAYVPLHTRGSLESLFRWVAAGRPTDPAGLAKIFGKLNTGKGNDLKIVTPGAITGSSWFPDKSKKVQAYLASNPGAGVNWEHIASPESFKSPNFGLSYVDFPKRGLGKGFAGDTYMSHLLVPGRDTKVNVEPAAGEKYSGRFDLSHTGLAKLVKAARPHHDVIEAVNGLRGALINHKAIYLPYKVGAGHVAQKMGIHMQQAQERIWAGIIGVMALKKAVEEFRRNPTATVALARLNSHAISQGWNLHDTLATRPILDLFEEYLGVPEDQVRKVLNDAQKRFGAASGRERQPRSAGVGNRAALERVIQRIPPATQGDAAARGVLRALKDKLARRGQKVSRKALAEFLSAVSRPIAKGGR